MITIQNLFKSYGENHILQNITATFEKGKVIGIVGENGSGKTTLFKCIAGLEKYSGVIKCDFPILKNHLGFLQTDPYFFPKITGKEYLQLFCNARNILKTDFDAKNIFDLPLNQYASTYSTGMKKKLALTAILTQGNDYFILDEPFNGTDIQGSMIITEIIHQLRILGKTILISSHIFSTLSDNCDEIHLLKNGSITMKVFKDEFGQLEKEMKDITIGNKIERLGLKQSEQ